LIRNISIDFIKGQIDYVSLNRIFSEIRFIIETNTSFINDSLHLEKLCALFGFYLDHIFTNPKCSSIFDLSLNLRADIIYLVVKSGRWLNDFNIDGEFNSNRLILFLKKFYKDNRGQSYFVAEMLSKYRCHPEFDFQMKQKGVTSFTELARFSHDPLSRKYRQCMANQGTR